MYFFQSSTWCAPVDKTDKYQQVWIPGGEQNPIDIQANTETEVFPLFDLYVFFLFLFFGSSHTETSVSVALDG